MFYLIKFREDTMNGAAYSILSVDQVEVHILNETEKRVYQNNVLLYDTDVIEAVKLLTKHEIKQTL